MSVRELLPGRHGAVPRAGLNETEERIFRVVSLLLVIVLASGWVWVIYEAALARVRGERPPAPNPDVANLSRSVSTEFLTRSTSTPAFLNEVALGLVNPFRGESGALKAAIVDPGAHLDVNRREGQLQFRSSTGQVYRAGDTEAPTIPGLYSLSVAMGQASKPVDDFGLITLVPFSEKKSGRIGSYLLGSWPYERGGTPRSERYADPRGFIEVTPENKDFRVSEHFTLGAFLTKGQTNVWPKYLLLDPLLLDKAELTIQELERMGVDVQHVEVMSGFRTPSYNAGGGNTQGRANLSRHMYGDAADMFVDNDRNGWMDDINGDGNVDTDDARMMAQAAERVEKRYPQLVGGIGVYKTCCGHGPFTHIDVRGYRARW